MATEIMTTAQIEVEFNNLVALAKGKTTANHISAKFTTAWCPYIQYITFDALDPQDYPNGIDANSIYLTFEVNYNTKKVELHSFGHCYISPKDKKHPKFKYYAMRGMCEIAKTDYGVNKFRKQAFKNTIDLYNRMEKYYKAVMEAIKAYTSGYPYKEGIIQPTEENVA